MIEKIYFAVSAHSFRNAGTKSKLVLILGNNRQDEIHQTFDVGEGLEEGKAHLFAFDPPNKNLDAYFQYMRLGIRGADRLNSKFVFVFGDFRDNGRVRFEPIALQYYVPQQLSTDEEEGRLSVPLSRASTGNQYTEIGRIVILIQNAGTRGAGTNSPVLLTMEKKDGSVLEFEIPDGDLLENDAVYFTMERLRELTYFSEIRNIKLHIGGDNKWTPGAVWIMGVDNRPDDYEQVVTFVNIPNWKATNLDTLSEDPSEGKVAVTLYKAFL